MVITNAAIVRGSLDSFMMSGPSKVVLWLKVNFPEMLTFFALLTISKGLHQSSDFRIKAGFICRDDGMLPPL